MSLLESGEMYLETILRLLQTRENVRSVDVSEYMGYSKPSISRAMGLLRKGGYITIDSEGFISLTDSGLKIAQKIYDRHTFLTDLLIRLGVSPETAAADACKLEHGLSDESFQAIKNYVNCP